LCIGCLLHTVFSFVGSCLEVSSRGRVCSCKLSNAPTVKHLAVIMDGNRRYGRSKYGVATKGHWDGGQTLCDFIDWSMEGGVEILTV
jgi:undecaprenyl pyrophosphate synthase